MKLFHISKQSNIDRFIPRKSKEIWGYKKYVWAISEKMLHNYLFPRDCPRICVGMDVAVSLSEWIVEEDTRDKEALIFISEDWNSLIDWFGTFYLKYCTYFICCQKCLILRINLKEA